MKQHLIKTTLRPRSLVGMALMMALAAPVEAETITIAMSNNGTSSGGIAGEGLPFTKTMSGSFNDKASMRNNDPPFALLTVGTSDHGGCVYLSDLKMMGGYLALPIPGVPGVGLVPRATVSASYQKSDGKWYFLAGSIGLPETKGNSTSDGMVTPWRESTQLDREWCLPPSNRSSTEYYYRNSNRTVTISGTWVFVTEGVPKGGEYSLPTMYFFSADGGGYNNLSTPILSLGNRLRILTMFCSVDTPTTIDFGPANRNIQAGTELAVKSTSLVTSCTALGMVTTNINLRFRAISGLYNGEASRLTLNQGGGYITGEIDNGVTGSGACTATTGLKFDNSVIKLGAMRNETSKETSNNVIWRLCSGGSNLPTGKVDASAEMLVTFN